MADPRYDEAIFPTDLLLALAMIAPERGVQPECLCRGLGFSVEDLSKPTTRVSYRQASLMIRRALEAIPDPALGLTLGARGTLGSMGLIGHAMAMCPTLGEAMNLALEHLVLTGAVGYRIELRVGGGLLWLELEHNFPDPDIQAFITEEAFASALTYARALTGGKANPVQVDFTHPERGSGAFAHEVFGVPVRFGCTRNRFVLEPSLLALPVPTHHPLGLRQALDLLEQFTRQERAKDDLCSAVERAAYRTLTSGITLEDIARELNMSSRTLRRRLAGSGMSFEALVENVRKTRALSLLTHSDAAVERVAQETGYSDVRNFRRAFKRWTGVSPSEYRH
ncbi:MAG: AraC family transcriptional regulator [Nevskiaceae bacterium]|nr:MAG: AraC family transcriptional regulator [Nevskiaceae bacterium]